MKVGIILANGFEEIEAVTPIDTLRRAGLDVVVIGLGSTSITGSHNITIQCDIEIKDLECNLDCIILPGGMPGAQNIAESDLAIKLINKTYENLGLVAAICASPGLVLGKTDILTGKKFTCYPGFEKYTNNGSFSEDRVVIDGKLITSRGPGTALEFSLSIVEFFLGANRSLELKKGMLTI